MLLRRDRTVFGRFLWRPIVAATCMFLIVFFVVRHYTFENEDRGPPNLPIGQQEYHHTTGNSGEADTNQHSGFDWANRKQDYPVTSFATLPKPESTALPKVQFSSFPVEPEAVRLTREERQNEVKAAMKHCWDGYREHAWLRDEVLPLSGGTRAKVGNWGATLIDSLDTLWMMGLKDEYEEGVEAALGIDFTTTTEDYVSVFETTIRYLGSFLATYDLSGDKRLLDKALEVADTLYAAFDTPNHIPVLLLFMKDVMAGQKQIASNETGLASIATLSLEFTRLTQLTGDDKWYDAIARLTNVLAASQSSTNLPGMWPTIFNGQTLDFNGPEDLYTLAGSSDSAYEYLIKEYILLGGSSLYSDLYTKAMETVQEQVLFRPMVPSEANILMAGHILTDRQGKRELKPELDHLACFSGGMLALGGKILNLPSHVDVGRLLTEGCMKAYNVTTLGVMPEESYWIPCPKSSQQSANSPECPWNEQLWLEQIRKPTDEDATTPHPQPPKGITYIQWPTYIMRPEAIESIFILYRITGDPSFQETAWEIFSRMNKATKTEIANAGLKDVMDSTMPHLDEMESFFMAETLKYFWLVFAEPDVLSLDEYVFNTEAHPFRRPN